MYCTRILNVLLFVFVYFTLVSSSTKLDKLRNKELPPCRACKILTDSFNKGMTQTQKGKYEGGDTAWEEEKLGSYATSEIRLVEIQENLCKDIDEGRNQCFSFAEEHDSLLEEWWFKHQSEEPNLHVWLCINHLKTCCPENHFGPDCLACPGHPNNVCNKNGKCKGAGTRKGNGQCICDAGYQGDNCSECAENYYVSYKDENKLLCSKCHQSCAGSCTGAGNKEVNAGYQGDNCSECAENYYVSYKDENKLLCSKCQQSCAGSCTGAGNKGCKECAKGYLMDPERGCLDINECAFEKPACKNSQFCVNTDGSFKCLDCDRSCTGCTGDGPDMCVTCAPGYTLFNNMCVDTSQQQRTSYVNITRYLTYIGLCVATCIILQRNVIIAAVIGLSVALYISVSEYMISTTTNSPNNIIDPDSILKAIR